GGRGGGGGGRHILVGQGEANGRAPVAPEAILPPARAGVELTMSPVSGRAVPSKFVLGAGRPPGAVKNPPAAFPTVHGGALAPSSHTAPSESEVVRLPEWKTAA